jgi:hypothetical protein
VCYLQRSSRINNNNASLKYQEMTENNSEQTSIDFLITLKSQYEYALTEVSTKSTYLREQLSHVNALLLNQLLPGGATSPVPAQLKEASSALALSAQVETLGDNRPALTPSLAVAEPIPSATKTSGSKSGSKLAQKRAEAKTAKPPSLGKVSGKRNSLTLLPAYQGLRKLEAIGKVLEAVQGQEVTIDSVVQTLYGSLSAAEHKAERFRMKTAMFQGVQKNLWKKALTPSSYFIEGSQGQRSSQPLAKKSKQATPKKPAGAKVTPEKATTVSKKRNSLPLLPEFEGEKKLDAIAMVLEKYRGEVLHHDTIIQTLYGDLSIEDLKAERVRIKTALLTGVKNKRWDKAPKPSSYVLRSGTSQAKPKSSKALAAKTTAKPPTSKVQKKKSPSAKKA